MASVVVVGGGIAGLAASIFLAREGHAVRVLERDPAPAPADPEQAFHGWHRPGVPQAWHSHAFLSRLRNLLRDRAPDLLAGLLDAGARELRFVDNLPPGLADRTPQPGDDDLVLLGCRRVTFEWALRRAALAEPGVVFASGVRVRGLLGENRDGVARVGGVAVRGRGGDETLRADVVVDASGRRSRVVEWLAALGAAPAEEDEDAGIFYASRFYRILPGASAPAGPGVVGADLGYMKYGIFPGDRERFSVTLAAVTDDPELRHLLRPAPFEAAARELPAPAEWIDPRRAVPVTGVRGMAGLRNRVRRFAQGERPLALGFFAIGDAAVCTNPLYGRGCSLAVVHAALLADALRAHPRDPAAASLALAEATRREIEPWFRAARDQDRDALAIARAQRRGEDPYAPEAADGSVDPRRYLRAVFRDGLMPLLRSDPAVLRSFARTFNLLDPPEDLMRRPELLPRVLASYQARVTRPPEAALGPPREQMVAVLERAA